MSNPLNGVIAPSAAGGGGAGVSGLATADGGDAIANNALIRGDGTDGIQGGVLTSADFNGDLAGPTAATDTTAAGGDFANQPANDAITVESTDAGDTGITVTLIGTTNGTDTVVVEDVALDGVDATTPVTSTKVDWGKLLAVKLSGAATGDIRIREASGSNLIGVVAALSTSAGVDTGSISAWNRLVEFVADGATTKQIGIKGTNSSGTTIYDSQALTGTTSALSNSAFVTISEYYVGDVESARTVAITAIEGLKFNSNFLVEGPSSSTDNAIARFNGANGNLVQNSGVTVADGLSGAVVVGALGSTDNAIPRANGTGGSTLEGSLALVSDTGSLYVPDGQGVFEDEGVTGWKFTSGDEIDGYSNNTLVARIAGWIRGMQIASDAIVAWSSTTAVTGTKDTAIGRVAAGQVAIRNETNGQATNIKTSATTVTLSGATSTATGLFPAKCIQLGVSYRVTTAVTGATSFDVGDGSDVDRYGATIAVTLSTTGNLSNATADPRGWSASAGDVVFTANGSNFTGGVVRVVAHYIDLTAPTS